MKHQEATDSTDKVVQDLPESLLDHYSLPLSSSLSLCLSETIMNGSKEHQNQELTNNSMVHGKGPTEQQFFPESLASDREMK